MAESRKYGNSTISTTTIDTIISATTFITTITMTATTTYTATTTTTTYTATAITISTQQPGKIQNMEEGRGNKLVLSTTKNKNRKVVEGTKQMM